MKYDEKLFNLSKDSCANLDTSKIITDEELEKKLKKLLKILFKRFQIELKQNKDNNGVLKFKIYLVYFGRTEEGYNEIYELMGNPTFHSFIGDYCIYISDYSHTLNEYNDAYYEVIWDYQKYYESLDKEKVKKKNI